MRAIWSGSISFGLVKIPVKLLSAVKERELSFDLLSKKDNSPIRYKRVSESTGKEISYQDIVKGFEYSKGRYVIVTPQDFTNASPDKSHSIDILQFTSFDSIDPIYYDKAYYLVPDKGAEKIYHLLWKALSKSNTVGIAEFVLRTRAHPVALRPWHDGALLLHQMHYAGEIGSIPDSIPDSDRTSPKELSLAMKLVESLSKEFDAATFKDTYTAKLKRVIRAKAKGKTVTIHEQPKKERGKVIDLMEELKRSLSENKPRSPQRRKTG